MPKFVNCANCDKGTRVNSNNTYGTCSQRCHLACKTRDVDEAHRKLTPHKRLQHQYDRALEVIIMYARDHMRLQKTAGVDNGIVDYD